MTNRRSALTLICLAALIAISAGFRIYHLGFNSYWIDELVSVHFANNPSWRAIFWDNNPFLYHLLLKLWIWLFGTTEAATRSLSLLFSAATTGLMFRLGRRAAGFGAGLVMGGLHCISVISITYAQETRMYALFEFSAALSFNFFADIWRTRKGYLGFICSAPLLVLSSYLAVVPLGLEGLWLWFSFRALRNRRMKPKRFLIMTALGLGAAVAIGSYFARFSWHHLEWQKYKYDMEPASHWPGAVFWMLFSQSRFAIAGYALLFASLLWNGVGTRVLGTWVPGTWSGRWLRRRRSPSEDGRPAPLAVISILFFFTPLILFQIESVAEHRSVFLPRYFIYLNVYLLCWTGLTLAGLWDKGPEKTPRKKSPRLKVPFTGWSLKRILASAAAALLVFGDLTSLPRVYDLHKSPWNRAAELISKYPDSFGLTTRTAAIQSPYFEKFGMKVEKWDPEQQKLSYILEKVGQHENVWMIENYYGGIQYFDHMVNRLKENGLNAEPFTISEGRGEPVLLLRIIKNPPAEEN